MADASTLAGTATANSGEQASVNTALTGINNVVGVAANWFQVIGTLAPLIANAESSAPDPLTLLEGITYNLNQLLQGLGALAAETKMLFLAPIIGHARDRLNALLLGGKNGPDVDEPSFFADVQDAAYAFADDAYWIRPYLDSFVFWDPWFPNNGNPPLVSYAGAAFVYDPQISLLAFAAAISYFTSVVAIFHADTNDAPTVQPYFTDLATLLDQNYEKAVAGLTTVPVPSESELNLLAKLVDSYGSPVFADFHEKFKQFFNWFNIYFQAGGWPGEIGAVDVYSVFARSQGAPGYTLGKAVFPRPEWSPTPAIIPATNAGNIVDVYPGLERVLSLQSDQEFAQDHLYRWFHIRMRIGNLARLKALYLAKGYHQIWCRIQKLRFLSSGRAGTPALNFPATPSPSATDRNAHWCLSELDPIISELDGVALFGNPYAYEKFVLNGEGGGGFWPISAEDVISRLQAVVDNATNYPLDSPDVPVQTPRRPLSLRATIAAVTG
jgi:hypothetical protein